MCSQIWWLLQVDTLRAVLQAVTALVTNYGYLLATKTELCLQRLLAGVNEATHLAQQVLCMNALRSICASPPTVHFLHTTCAPSIRLESGAEHGSHAMGCLPATAFLDAGQPTAALLLLL